MVYKMILGVDVSKWQGLIDWNTCREAGAQYAFIRAGSCNAVSGVCYEDNLFKENSGYFEDHQGAPALMPVGYYWYFRPQHNPMSQANYFCDLLDGADYLLPPVIDCENNGGLSPSAYADSIKTFLDRVEARTGYKPIIYTSKSKWAEVEPRSYWPSYDLWVAHYTLNTEPLVPDGLTWTFWQYTSQGDAVTYGGPGPPSGDDDIDLNWFNGTEDEFLLYIGATPMIPERVVVSNPKNAIFWEKPGGLGKRLLIAPEGLCLAVMGVAEVDGKVWYDFGLGWLPSGTVEEL